MKRKVFVSLTLIAVFLTTLILNSASAPHDIKTPKFEVILSSHAVMQPEVLENWFYITNPSKEMERIGVHGETILHSIEVNWIKVTIGDPDGDFDWLVIYPNGTCVTNEGTSIVPWLGDRIRTVVHPMEKALVYYGGWGFTISPPGTYILGYGVNFEYEEQTFELAESAVVVIR